MNALWVPGMEIEFTRSVRRKDEERRWDTELLRSIISVPWNHHGVFVDAPGGQRRRYITRDLIEKHGGTAGCPGCDGDSQVHVPRCRRRFEAIFRQEQQPGGERIVCAPGPPAIGPSPPQQQAAAPAIIGIPSEVAAAPGMGNAGGVTLSLAGESRAPMRIRGAAAAAATSSSSMPGDGPVENRMQIESPYG